MPRRLVDQLLLPGLLRGVQFGDAPHEFLRLRTARLLVEDERTRDVRPPCEHLAHLPLVVRLLLSLRCAFRTAPVPLAKRQSELLRILLGVLLELRAADAQLLEVRADLPESVRIHAPDAVPGEIRRLVACLAAVLRDDDERAIREPDEPVARIVRQHDL